MQALYVLVLVCRIGEPVCDTRTATAYQAFRAPPGFVICAGPAFGAQNAALAPREGEETHIKCRLGVR